MAKFKVSMTWDDGTDEYTTVADSEHAALRQTLYIGGTTRVVIERVNEPESWPPHPGDVWEAEGKLYSVGQSTMRSSAFIIRDVVTNNIRHTSYATVPRLSLDTFKALNPTLVKRQDAS